MRGVQVKTYLKISSIKIVRAELLQEGIFFPHPFICQRSLISKKNRNGRN